MKTAPLIALTLLPFLILAARADDALPATAQVSDPVPGHGDVTYFDLLAQMVPKLTLNHTGATAPAPAEPFRNIAGPDNEGQVPDPMQVDSVEPLTIKVGGETRILVVADFGAAEDRVADITLLGLFDDSPTPKLLDFADIGLDQFSGFATVPAFRIGPNDEAISLDSSHSNSDESYEQPMLLFVRDSKLKLIDDYFVFGERTCNFQQDQVLAVKELPSNRKPYWSFRVEVTQTRSKTKGDDCPEPTPKQTITKVYSGTYSWDAKAQNFVTKSKELDRLAKENEALNEQE